MAPDDRSGKDRQEVEMAGDPLPDVRERQMTITEARQHLAARVGEIAMKQAISGEFPSYTDIVGPAVDDLIAAVRADALRLASVVPQEKREENDHARSDQPQLGSSDADQRGDDRSGSNQ